MKEFSELNKYEMAALTDEQIAQYVNLRCAEEGVPVFRVAPIAPEKPEVKPDVTAYQVTGTEYIFARQEDALALQAFLQDKQVYSWTYGYGHKYIRQRGNHTFAVSTDTYFSEALIDAHGDALTEYKTLKEEYDKEKKKHDSVISDISSIRSDIWDCVFDAKKFVEEEVEMIALWANYKTLAGENTGIAKAFLLKAYPDCLERFNNLAQIVETDAMEEETKVEAV